jgi:hypothetical protein
MFFDAIQYVFQKGIFSGVSDTEFSPEGSMSRGMFVTVLGRLAKINVEAYRSDSAFFDVAANLLSPYVTWAAEVGITVGIGGGLFAPEDLVTRAQMATLIMKFYQAMEIELPEEITDQTLKISMLFPTMPKTLSHTCGSRVLQRRSQWNFILLILLPSGGSYAF